MCGTRKDTQNNIVSYFHIHLFLIVHNIKVQKLYGEVVFFLEKLSGAKLDKTDESDIETTNSGQFDKGFVDQQGEIVDLSE